MLDDLRWSSCNNDRNKVHNKCNILAAATKSLQSCPTLCNPIDGAAHQAPLSLGFSRQGCWNGWPFPSPMHACMLSRFSRVRLHATLWTAAHQAPLSTEFSLQEYWSGLPFPSPIIHLNHPQSTITTTPAPVSGKKKVISQNQSLGPKRLGATALIDFWQAWPLVYSPPLPFALPPCPATLQFWFKQVRSNQPPTLSVAFPGGFTVLPGSSLPASCWPFPPTSGVSHPFLKKCCF